MRKRTPILGLVIAAVMSVLIIVIFGVDERPFTTGQAVLLYFTATLPSVGIAMLFDPYSAMVKKRYMKINFYIQEENPADQLAKVIAEEENGN